MEHISVREVADNLNVSRQYAWQLIKQGKLKAKQVGRSFIVTMAEFEEYKQSIKNERRRKNGNK